MSIPAKRMKMSIPDEYIHAMNVMKTIAGLEEHCDVTLVSDIDKQK